MKLKDLQATENLFQFILEAKRIWVDKSEETYKETGDRGACTVGGGIFAEVIRPRCRNSSLVRLLEVPTRFQGEVPKYAGMKEAAEFLRSKLPGIKIVCDYGRMD